MRISRKELYMEIAQLFSKRSTCGRLQVGCAIVRNGRIIASGYNGALPGDRNINGCNCDLNKPCEKAVHAEANAIAFAAQNGIKLKGSTIHVTHSPCLKCAELIIQAGIFEVVYKELFRDDKGLLLLKANNIQIGEYVPPIQNS